MEFQAFRKIPRLSRDIIITEKIDGTNAQIFITNFLRYPDYVNWVDSYSNVYLNEYGYNFIKNYSLFEKNGTYIFAGSKNRWLDTSSKGDNFGFAKWVQSNASKLFSLGEGRHYGEWFGKGIQRGYGLQDKRFALFNVGKRSDPEVRPKCCEVVPILWEGMFDTEEINNQLFLLKENGSYAVKGYEDPEGIIIFHTASGQLFKKTIKDDEKPKGRGNE